MASVIWSINIMILILLIAVSISIYWIFKYDDWYPNPIVSGDKSEHIHTGIQDLGVGAE
tara:strand:+ start:132 stop:308 length:177 start_codon:yes stop_codon:yes gene_type:complete